MNFSICLETALNFNAFSKEELALVIRQLSPFDSAKKSNWVESHFKRGKQLARGYQGYSFDFNGLYQELALAYAAGGDVPRSLLNRSTRLIKYSESYYQRDYTNMMDNAANVASVLYRARRVELLDPFVAGYCQHKRITEIEFYQRLLGRAQPYNLTRLSNYQIIWNEAHNPNLSYGEAGEVAFFYEKYRGAINKLNQSDERNFLLALSYKDQGITIAHKAEVAGGKYDRKVVEGLFDKSIEHYSKVSGAYASESTEQTITASADLVFGTTEQAVLVS